MDELKLDKSKLGSRDSTQSITDVLTVTESSSNAAALLFEQMSTNTNVEGVKSGSIVRKKRKINRTTSTLQKVASDAIIEGVTNGSIVRKKRKINRTTSTQQKVASDAIIEGVKSGSIVRKKRKINATTSTLQKVASNAIIEGVTNGSIVRKKRKVNAPAGLSLKINDQGVHVDERKVNATAGLSLKINDQGVHVDIEKTPTTVTFIADGNSNLTKNEKPKNFEPNQIIPPTVQSAVKPTDFIHDETVNSEGNTFETLEEYNTSTEVTDVSPPTTKRRKKVSKAWLKMADFPNLQEATKVIKDENIWTKCNTNVNEQGTAMMYRCKKVKARGQQCSAGVKLLLSLHDLSVTLFKSENLHDCDKVNEGDCATGPITEEVKGIIKEHFENGLKNKRIRQELFKLKTIHLPSKVQLYNYLAELRKQKFGRPTLTISQLDEVLKQYITVPETEVKGFVVDYHLDAEHAKFKLFISSKVLLNNSVDAKIQCADATYKLLWQGFPVHVLGTVDMNKKFHPSGIGVADTEDGDDFAFMFNALKKGVNETLNKDINPKIVMCDAAKAISNGFKLVFGDDILVLMCWAHMKRAVKKKLKSLVPKAKRNEILSDIDKLQLSQSPIIFDKASKLFINKYHHFEEFIQYFQYEWLQQNPNWYEGAAPFKVPSTDNALESFNRVIKDENTLRERLPLELFIKLLLTWIESWGVQYEAGDNILATITTVDLPLLTRGYQWLISKKTVKKNVNGAYMVPGGDQTDLSKWKDIGIWNTFEEFKTNAFLGYTTIVPADENWIHGTCTCPAFYKNFMCKHVVGIAMRLKYIEIPIEAKNIPIGSKRKRGRPAKAKRALIIQ